MNHNDDNSPWGAQLKFGVLQQPLLQGRTATAVIGSEEKEEGTISDGTTFTSLYDTIRFQLSSYSVVKSVSECTVLHESLKHSLAREITSVAYEDFIKSQLLKFSSSLIEQWTLLILLLLLLLLLLMMMMWLIDLATHDTSVHFRLDSGACVSTALPERCFYLRMLSTSVSAVFFWFCYRIQPEIVIAVTECFTSNCVRCLVERKQHCTLVLIIAAFSVQNTKN